jgi:membrane protease YdiL (CAAX protease family)
MYLRLYLRCIFNSWLLLGVVGIIVLHDGIPFSSIGLLLPNPWWPTLLAFIGVGILSSVVLVIHLRTMKDEQFAAKLAREKRRLALPRSSSERLVWVGVSITAGVWEEVGFRGFLPWYFVHHLTLFGFSIPFVWAAIFSLILFSLGHLYQGWRGVLGVGFLGITQALLYALTGNLLASMLWHMLFDVRFSFGTPTIEPVTQPVDEMKDLPESPLPLREPSQSRSGSQQQRQNKCDQRSQSAQRIPYYARRLPPYSNIPTGRRQQRGSP